MVAEIELLPRSIVVGNGSCTARVVTGSVVVNPVALVMVTDWRGVRIFQRLHDLQVPLGPHPNLGRCQQSVLVQYLASPSIRF